MKLVRVLSLVLAGAALVAWPAADVRATAVETITVGPAAHGTRRTLRRGDLLVVRLPANPSTGYSWAVRSAGCPVLARAGRSYLPPRSARLGAPGTAVLRFRATAPGSAALRLAYARAWERGVPPARVFTVRVTVA